MACGGENTGGHFMSISTMMWQLNMTWLWLNKVFGIVHTGHGSQSLSQGTGQKSGFRLQIQVPSNSNSVRPGPWQFTTENK